MAKLIVFNNTNYPIDEASLSAATDALKSHLSTVMNGTGATIRFGGVAYNIDSTKLSAATNDFVTHLGTVSGDGYKVVVNGTEHNVASAKMTTAVSDLEVVLGGLISEGGDEGSQMPEKNAYGFYFNVPYVAEINDGSTTRKNAIVFYDDGTMISFSQDLVGEDGIPSDATELLTHRNYCNIIDYSDLGADWTLSEDGKTLVSNYNGVVCTAQGIEHSIYFGETYISQDGETFIPYESNKIVFGGDLGEQVMEGWEAKGHWSQSYFMRVYASVDGTVVYAGNRYDGLKAYYFDPSAAQ